MNTMKTIQKAIEQFGSPLYYFDGERLKERVSFLRSSLPEHVQICYAAKANTFVLPIMKSIVDHYEICSPGEFKICKRLGISNQNIVLSGVYKNPQDLLDIFSSQEELPTITIESIEQFKLIFSLSEQTKRNTKILLRLTSGNQFGLDLEELKSLVCNRNQYPYLEFLGIQYFSGTQKYSQKKICREMDLLKNMLNEFKILGYQPSILEYGPGFPVDYYGSMPYEENKHLVFFSEQLMQFKDMTIVLELGRSLVAHCGSYVTQVVDKKTNAGQNYVIVDGGIHHLVYYGQGIAMKLPSFTFLPANASSKEGLWNVCGSLCTVNDILMKQVTLPEPSLGDYFIFKNTGAYCPTEGMSLFLTRDLPAICASHNGRLVCLRDHTSIIDLNTPKGE